MSIAHVNIARTIVVAAILCGCPGIGVSTETSGGECLTNWEAATEGCYLPSTGSTNNNTSTEDIVTSTSDSTGNSETTSLELIGYCGDGIIDDNEYCDNGSENKQYLDASPIDCTIDCKYPVCGDGNQNLTEECDNGDMGKLNGCDNCVQCGNGIVSGNEVCDDGTDMPARLDTCEACKPQIIVFVTSEKFQGNFVGLEAADKICQNAIEKSDASDKLKAVTFKAWLSDSQFSPENRFSENILKHTGRIREVYIGANENTITENGWIDLIGGNLSDSINRDENGNQILGNEFAWTGSSGNYCGTEGADWMSNGKLSFGSIGSLQMTDSQWHLYEGDDLNDFSCEKYYHFYCFSQ